MKNALNAAVIASLLLAVSACTTVPSGIDPAYQTPDTSFLGTWTSQRGTTVKIDHLGGAAFDMVVSDGAESASYRGHLLEVGGAQFAEISVFQPGEKNEIPVYIYAMVDVNESTMIHKPIRPEWMAQESRTLPGAIYHSTSQEQPGSGGVVVRDRSAMLTLLRKAAADPSAFGPAETLTRK